MQRERPHAENERPTKQQKVAAFIDDVGDADGAGDQPELDHGPFEGPEKVLEVHFGRTPEEVQADKDAGADGRYALRTVKRERWEVMLAKVRCTIIGFITNEHLDAYMLSESSMFVYPYRVAIKTCGTTTLLHCVETMLQIVREDCGIDVVEDVFYNRQSLFFPDKQLHPHRTFMDEVGHLDSYFKHGSAYVVGKLNGNHYNVYHAANRRSADKHDVDPDTTLEIIMTGLSRSCMRQFYKQGNPLDSDQVTKSSGIADIFPGALLNTYLFEPYGYSMNGLLGEGYFTIHITPQPSSSFVSFETNILKRDYTEVINKVLACFQPERFIVTHVANTYSTKYKKFRHGFDVTALVVPGRQIFLEDDLSCKFDCYDLVFCQLEADPAKSPGRAGALNNGAVVEGSMGRKAVEKQRMQGEEKENGRSPPHEAGKIVEKENGRGKMQEEEEEDPGESIYRGGRGNDRSVEENDRS